MALIGWPYSKTQTQPTLEKLQQDHCKKQKCVSKKKVPFSLLRENVVDKCGHVIFKDSKVVVFHTNDLAASMLMVKIVQQDNKTAIRAVHSLGNTHRWTGK